MPAKRNASASRSRSRGRRARSASTSRTPARSRSRRSPVAAAAAAVAALPGAVKSVFQKPKATPPTSMWEADAKLMDAMSSGRSNSRSTGVRKLFRGKKGRVWGFWVAIIIFQVIAIVWAKWAIDMYKQYRNKVH
ncbi:hypothetical protein ABB37_04587 [Leptomonas pyrrhocoris]|uniref:Uncharacterized protein n=1 Tax=Leptomonas pyrrhocoris TaxID=157538 RepID=A0A0M9G168_LEPPY|nr:hypothetical protein ABB37_04587 [Leptomonas pyrrhocoris]KPA80300.1 hypothetical protein ABB37_04587 [Leptomonas pyrrhocoris]|eukprot:XP_015658739.1 hypothetical protein ABB37_04587 [Leptomonas pyrrhocoris]